MKAIYIYDEDAVAIGNICRNNGLSVEDVINLLLCNLPPKQSGRYEEDDDE